jgi:hypothetical protein
MTGSGRFPVDYPVDELNISVVEVPSDVTPSLYGGCRYLGQPNVLLIAETGFDPSTFLTLLELPPGGLGTAIWDGTQWLSTLGGVPTGGLVLEPANVSDPTLPVYSGGDVTINCEYTCTDPTATVTYSWTNGGGLPIVGATSSSFTFTGITEEFEGNYTCTVLADNGTDIGSLAQTFNVVVYPVIP